jgi:DNA-binding NarL/FixJ family response regulator
MVLVNGQHGPGDGGGGLHYQTLCPGDSPCPDQDPSEKQHDPPAPPETGGGKKKAEPFPPLTPWEWQIALLAQRRLTVREISKKMGITENTTKSALKNIYGKLNIHSKLNLAELDLGD